MVIPIQWRPKYIEGYECEYGVCRAGFVYSFKSWKFMKGNTQHGGYLKVGLRKNGIYKQFKVHRLVAQVFIDNPNNLPVVNHINEVKTDNRVENLEWVTQKENTNYITANSKKRGRPRKENKKCYIPIFKNKYKPNKEKVTCQIKITQEDKDHYIILAKEAGMPLQDFLAQVLYEHLYE